VRHVAVAANFVGGINNDHPLFLCQGAGGFAQHGGFANARLPQNEQRFARFNQVVQNVDGAVHGASHPAGEAHNVPAPVSDGRNAVQGALEPGAVVGVKFANVFHHKIQFFARHFTPAQFFFTVHKTGSWNATQVKDNFQQVIRIIKLYHRFTNVRRQHFQKVLQIVGYSSLRHISWR